MDSPAFCVLTGSDKADGPAAVYTGGSYGLFSRYLAERPFPQSLALQTFLSFFVSFFPSFVLGQTNKNQSERLNCPEAPGARFTTQRSKTSKTPAARLNPTYKLPLTEPIAPVR